MKINFRKVSLAVAGTTLALTMAFSTVSAGTFNISSVPYASAKSVTKTKTTDTKKIGCTAKCNVGNPRTIYVYAYDSDSSLLAPIVKAKEDAGTVTNSYYSGKTGNKGKKITIKYRDSTGVGIGSYSTDTTINYY